MRPSGESNIGIMLVGAAVVALIYAVVIFAPAYLDNLAVRTQCEAGLNQGADGENLIKVVMNKLNGGGDAVGYHFEEDDDGVMQEVRGLGVTPENFSVFTDEAKRTRRLTIDYERTIILKPSSKRTVLHFHVEKEVSSQR